MREELKSSRGDQRRRISVDVDERIGCNEQMLQMGKEEEKELTISKCLIYANVYISAPFC